jgi:hypothetical protein
MKERSVRLKNLRVKSGKIFLYKESPVREILFFGERITNYELRITNVGVSFAHDFLLFPSLEGTYDDTRGGLLLFIEREYN